MDVIFVSILAVLTGAALGLAWLTWNRRRAEPDPAIRAIFWAAIGLLGTLSLAYALVANAPIILLVFMVLAFPLLRLWQDEVSAQARKNKRQGTGRESVWDSSWITLRVNHDDGACRGLVKQGPMADWRLDEMDQEDLKKLRVMIVEADGVSAVLLDLWLDKHGPIHWRHDFGGAQAVRDCDLSQPDRAEAAAWLGVAPDADAAAIAEASSRLEGLFGISEHAVHVRARIAAARLALVLPG